MNPKDNATQITIPYRLTPAMFPAGIITPRMLVASPKVAKGDMYYSQDGVSFVRLPGTNGTALVFQSGVPTWLAGFSGTVVLAKLTTTNGSLTVVNGIITAYVAPT